MVRADGGLEEDGVMSWRLRKIAEGQWAAIQTVGEDTYTTVFSGKDAVRDAKALVARKSLEEGSLEHFGPFLTEERVREVAREEAEKVFRELVEVFAAAWSRNEP